MKKTKTLMAVMALYATVLMAGCGGGGGGQSSLSSNSGNPAGGVAVVTGRAIVNGGADAGGIVVVAEKQDNGVTSGVQNMIDAAKTGARLANREALTAAETYTAVTDAAGNYTLRLPEGTYSIGAFKQDAVAAQPKIVYAVSAAAVTVNFELTATGKISGVATLHGGGRGNAGITVFVTGTSFAAYTDDMGAFTISNVPVGSYSLNYVKDNYQWGVTTAVTVTAGATTTIGAFNMTTGPSTPLNYCGATAKSNIATARGLIFVRDITQSSYNSAKSAIQAALTDSPDCPDANLLGAIVKLMDEYDRLNTNVFASTTPTFPISFGRIAAPLYKPVLESLPKVSAGLLTEDSAISLDQNEIITNVLPAVASATAMLDKVRHTIAYNPGWTFTYPKDPAEPGLGFVAIDNNDIRILSAAVRFIAASLNYSVAYNLDAPSTYPASDPCPEYDVTYTTTTTPPYYATSSVLMSTPADLAAPNMCKAADTNNDNILTPSEYLPAGVGVLRTNGLANLTNAKTMFATGLSMLESAVYDISQNPYQLVGGQFYVDEYASEIDYYKHYLTDLQSSMSGNSVALSLPSEIQCWISSGYGMFGYISSYSLNDPLSPSNLDDLKECISYGVTRNAITARINLGQWFTVADVRSVSPNYSIDTAGDTKLVASSISGNTFNGIFPDGFNLTWVDQKSCEFELLAMNPVDTSGNSIVQAILNQVGSSCVANTNSSACGSAGCTWNSTNSTCGPGNYYATKIGGTTGAVLSVGGKDLSNRSFAVFYYGGPTNAHMDIFTPCGESMYTTNQGTVPAAIPQSTDYYTFNAIGGTTVSFTMPGYSAKTVTVFGEATDISGLVLTPAP